MDEVNTTITVNVVVDFKPTLQARKLVIEYMAKYGINLYNQNILPCTALDTCEQFKRGRVASLKWKGEELKLEIQLDKPDARLPKENWRWHLTSRSIITGPEQKRRNEFFVYYF